MYKQEHTQGSFLQQVAADIRKRFGSDLRDIAIVFNNQRPIQYLRRYLAGDQGQVGWSPQFYTIQDFVRLSSPRLEINQTAQVFLLNQLHTALQRERHPAYEESLDHFFPVAEMILGDFAQLDYELADVGLVFRELSGMAELDRQFDFLSDEQKDFLMRFWSSFSADQTSSMQARFLQLWQLLPVLYQRFNAALEAAGNHTIAGIYRDLAESRSGARDVAGDFRQVLFVGFNALNACEARMFRRWQESEQALFYFDADRYYVDDPLMEAGHFIRQNINNHGLRNALGDFPAGLGTPQPGREICFAPAPGQVAQAKVLAHLLRDVPLDGSAAVILADESLLIPVLQSIPDTIDHRKVNITMGYPMSESLTHGLLQLFLDYQLRYAGTPSGTDPEIDQPLLVDLIGHPFMGCSAAERVQLLEELARYQEPLLPLSWVKEHLPVQVRNYPGFFQHLSNVAGVMHAAQELLAALALDRALKDVRGQIELALIEQAMQVFRQLQQGFASYPQLSVPLAIKLIRRSLGKLTATLPGDPLSGLQIMGLLESRNLQFEVIYLIGANEGNLPVLKAAPSFIPYNLRRAYRLPVIENQQSLSAYLFYRLLSGARTFTVIYNAVVDYQNTGEITRFAKQVQYESTWPVRQLSVLLEGSRQTPGSSSVAAATSELDTIRIFKTGQVWERLQAFLRETPAEQRRYLSASAFTLYLNSPLEFFFKYLAGIKEPPQAKSDIQSNRLGTVIHRTMELAYRPYLERRESLNAEELERLLSNLPALCEQAVIEEFYGARAKDQDDKRGTDPMRRPDRFTSQERIVLRLSEEYCRLFLQHDQQLGSAWTILELENTEDYLLEFPIRVSGREDSVLLKGIIDRIDSVEGQKRIVDYKTGGDALDIRASGWGAEGRMDYDFFQTNWDDSNKAFIQTLFYTLIYERLRSEQDIQPQLYSIRRIRTEGTDFKFKIPYKGSYPITGPLLEQVKADFLGFLQQKLEELFDPTVPFVHPEGATVYPGSPYAEFFC